MVLMVSASVPDAQAELPRTEDGAGVKVGQRSTFHPGIALVVGADTNVFWTDRRDNGGVSPAAVMTPVGWLGIGNREVRDGVLQSTPERSDRKVDYNLRVTSAYRAYLSRKENVIRQSRFNLVLDAHVNVAPGRKFSFSFDEKFSRLAEPRNYEAAPDYNFNRIDHRGALTFTFRPGGGRLSLAASYLSEALYYEAADIVNADRLVNGAGAEVKYRLFPRSSLALNYTFRNTYYLCCGSTGTGRNEDSDHHRVMVGYRGQIGERLLLMAMAGFGSGKYYYDDTGPNFSGPLAQLGVTYFPTLRTQLFAVFNRNFQDSLFGNYYIDTGGQIGASHLFRWKMLAFLRFEVYGRRYAGIPIPGQDISGPGQTGPGGTFIAGYDNADGFVRKDTVIGLNAKVEQPFGRFFVLALRYNLVSAVTPFAVRYGIVPGGDTDPNTPDRDYGRFVKNIVMLIGAVRF